MSNILKEFKNSYTGFTLGFSIKFNSLLYGFKICFKQKSINQTIFKFEAKVTFSRCFHGTFKKQCLNIKIELQVLFDRYTYDLQFKFYI